MQKYSKAKGLATSVDTNFGACTHEGQREITECGHYQLRSGQDPSICFPPPDVEDWQSIHGIYSNQAIQTGLRYQRLNVPYITMTQGDFVPDTRPDIDVSPVVDIWKLAGYLAEVINTPEFWNIDTLVIYTDDRPPQQLVGQPGLEQHCVLREIQRARLQVTERHGILFVHAKGDWIKYILCM